MDMTSEYVRTTFQLSPNASMPIYRQLTEYLARQIRSGVLKPGDRMLPENEMAGILGVSRTTVRIALDHLVEDGVLVRHRGRGSFIAEPRLRRTLNCLYDFTESIREAGAQPSSQVLQCKVIAADERIAEKLQLLEGNRNVFLLERLRLADGKPLLRETSLIPYFLCNGIEKNDFSALSLYAVLRKQYGLPIEFAEETIEAVIIDRTSSELLMCRPPTPGYRISRVARLNSGVVCEYTSSITRADQCVFRLDLHAASDRGGGMYFERKLLAGSSGRERDSASFR